MEKSIIKVIPDRDFMAHKVAEMMQLSEKLDEDIIKTNRLHYDFQTMHNKLAKELHKETLDLNKLIAQRKRYYNGQMPPEYYAKYPLNVQVNRKEINKYIDVDELVIGQRANVDEVEACIKVVEESKKRLSFRTNDIKVILEYRKFTSGVN